MTPFLPRRASAAFRRLSLLPAVAALTAAVGLRAQPPASSVSGGPAIFTGSAIAPEYPIPYRKPAVEEITAVLDRVRDFLDAATPSRLVDRRTGAPITDFSKPAPDAAFERGGGIVFQPVSYEWGVTYAGMLAAARATGDSRFSDYTARRLQLIGEALPLFRTEAGAAGAGGRGGRGNPLRSMISPGTLDDSGSMCAALVKARLAGIGPDLKPVIDTYIDWISHKQFRLPDGTLARMRPLPDTLWLDDLFMSVPALAQMGKLTGDRAYFDDAVRQIRQFSARMFNPALGVYMHGWTMSAPEHPEFHWSRANGWAIMAMVELLDVLPEDHPGRPEVLRQLQAHIKGIASFQTSTGFWHQLIDRPDSYLETSATAIFTYCIAHAINRGWVSAASYGPVAQLGWNAVATKVNPKGEVEGTCVGTDMAFDNAYYYYRPTSVTAAHGYGPVLLAGAEMIELMKNDSFTISSGVTQFLPKAGK